MVVSPCYPKYPSVGKTVRLEEAHRAVSANCGCISTTKWCWKRKFFFSNEEVVCCEKRGFANFIMEYIPGTWTLRPQNCITIQSGPLLARVKVLFWCAVIYIWWDGSVWDLSALLCACSEKNRWKKKLQKQGRRETALVPADEGQVIN